MHKFLTIISIALTLSACTSRHTPPDQPSMHETAYASIGELHMYYEIHGSGGIPLVLLHGGGSTIQTNWATILPLLATHRKVIAVELQAHGHTADVDRPESFEQDADDVAMLLRTLKIQKADLFGFSNGGNTSMQVAIRHPEVVNKLVIASSFYKREGMIPGFFKMMDEASLANMPAPLKTAFLAINPDSSALQAMHDKDAERMRGFSDWTDEALRSIQAPALIIIGDKDIVTPEHAMTMARLIPQARLMIVPGNHGSYLGEVCTVIHGSRTPEMVVGVVEEFLTSDLR